MRMVLKELSIGSKDRKSTKMIQSFHSLRQSRPKCYSIHNQHQGTRSHASSILEAQFSLLYPYTNYKIRSIAISTTRSADFSQSYRQLTFATISLSHPTKSLTRHVSLHHRNNFLFWLLSHHKRRVRYRHTNEWLFSLCPWGVQPSL